MKIELIENKQYGFYNIKFDSKPDTDILSELKTNGWAWSSHNGVWYPRTNEAKTNANVFATDFAKKYNEPEKSFGQVLFERTQRIDQWKKEHLPQEQNNEPGLEVNVELNENQKKVYELLKATNNFSENQILEMVSKIDTAYQTGNFEIEEELSVNVELSWEQIKTFIRADNTFDERMNMRNLYHANESETYRKIGAVYDYMHDKMNWDVLGENQIERNSDASFRTMRQSVRESILNSVCEYIVTGRYASYEDMMADFVSRRDEEIADISKRYMENPEIKKMFTEMKRTELLNDVPEILRGREFKSWLINVGEDGHFLFYESNGYLKSEYLNSTKYNVVKDFLAQVEEFDLLEKSAKQLKAEYEKMQELTQKPAAKIQKEIELDIEADLIDDTIGAEETDVTVSEYNDLGIDVRTGEPWNGEENGVVAEPEEESTELTQKDLDNATKVIPEEQYKFMLENAAGEESEYFKKKLKNMATICADLQKHSNRENVNKDGSHPCKLHYYLGNCDWYISELDNDGIGFGYCILNGDLYNSEWGSVNVCGDSTYEQPLTKMSINVPVRINETEFRRSVSPELDLHLDEDTTIERELYKLDNEYFAKYKKFAEKGQKVLAKSSEISTIIIEETDNILEVQDGSKTDIGYEGRTGISSGSNLNQGLEEPGIETNRDSNSGIGQRVLHSEREGTSELGNSEAVSELHAGRRESEYIDAVTAKEAGIERPEGERHPIYLELSPLQQRIIKLEQDAIAKADNPYVTLKAMTTMRTATLSPALLDPGDFIDVEDIVIPSKSQIVESSPKLSWVCNTCADLYKQKPECGQFIYMPQGKDCFDEVKNYLVKQGIPEDAIDYIHSTHNGSAEDKDRISARFNNKEDKLKILIGTTTVAEGIDLNGNSIVEYNTMLGWNPTESIQVEGRIWRQGNEQGKVHIMYPLMENSIDALIYQKHDEKASRINSVLSKTDDGKDAIDTDEINPETIKFELITDPTKKVKMIIDEKTAEKRKEIKIIDNRIETIQELEEDRQNCKSLYDTNIAEKEKYKVLLKAAREELKADPNNWRKEANVENNESAIDTCNKEIAKSKNRLNTISYNFNKFYIHDPEHEVPVKLKELVTKKAELQADITDIENSKNRLIADEQKKLLEKKILSKPVEELRKEWVEYVNKNTWYKEKKDKSKDRKETVQKSVQAVKDFKVPEEMLKKFDKAMSEMDFKVLHQYLNWGDRNVISDMHENDKAIEIMRERFEKTKGVKLPELFRKTTEYLVSVCDEKTLPEVCKFKSMEEAVAYACSSWHGEAYQRDGYVEYVTLDNFKKNRNVSALAKDLQKREGQSYYGHGSPTGFDYACSPKGVKIGAFINKKREEFFVNWNQVATIKAKQWNKEYPVEFTIKDEAKREGQKNLKNVEMVQQELFDFDEVKIQAKTRDLRNEKQFDADWVLHQNALVKYHGLPPFIKKSDDEWIIRCDGSDFAVKQEGIESYDTVDVSMSKEQLQKMVKSYLNNQTAEINHKKFENPGYKGTVVCPKPELSDTQKELLKSNGISDNDMKAKNKEFFTELLCSDEKPILRKKQPQQMQQKTLQTQNPKPALQITHETDFDFDY